MADETYSVVYRGDDANHAAAIARMMADLKALDALVDAVKRNMKTLGCDTPCIETAIKATRGYASAVRKLGRDAVDTEAKVKLLGQSGTLPTGGGGTRGGGGGGGGGTGEPPSRGSNLGRFGMGVARRIVGNAAQRVISATIGSHTESQQDEREFYEKSAEDAMDNLNDMRELASQMALSGPDADLAERNRKMMEGAGLSTGEAVEFGKGYFGSAPAGRHNIMAKPGPERDALEDSIRAKGAKFAVSTGMDLKTAGDLAGVISMYKKVGSADDVVAGMAGVHYGIDTGRGDISTLARSVIAQSGLAVTTGRAKNMEEVGALVGMASLVVKSGSGSGTEYERLSRLLNKTAGSGSEFIKKSGISEEKGDIAKLKRLKAVMDEEGVTKETQAEFLAKMEFGNSKEISAAVFMVNNIPQLEEKNRIAQEMGASSAFADKRIGQFYETEIGQDRLLQGGLEAQNQRMGESAIPLRQFMMKGNLARLKGDSAYPVPGTADSGQRARLMEMVGAGDGEEEMDFMDSMSKMVARAKAKGVDLSQMKDFRELITQQGAADPLLGKGEGRTRDTHQIRLKKLPLLLDFMKGLEGGSLTAAEIESMKIKRVGLLDEGGAEMDGTTDPLVRSLISKNQAGGADGGFRDEFGSFGRMVRKSAKSPLDYSSGETGSPFLNPSQGMVYGGEPTSGDSAASELRKAAGDHEDAAKELMKAAAMLAAAAGRSGIGVLGLPDQQKSYIPGR